MKKLILILVLMFCWSNTYAAEVEHPHRYPVIKITSVCENGMVFKIFQTIMQMKVIQVIGTDGKPVTCQDQAATKEFIKARKRVNESLNKAYDAITKAKKELNVTPRGK